MTFVRAIPYEFALILSLWMVCDLFYRLVQLLVQDAWNTGSKWKRRRAIEVFYEESGYQYYSLSDAIKDRNSLIIDQEKKILPDWYADWQKWEDK